ncbi:MAG TPA: hypothetical protein VHT91_43310 [Kofleriaceae bacterium]|jgi:hypothetical protein|nr:hypothetical protein [Kofleriaceae bacterium]
MTDIDFSMRRHERATYLTVASGLTPLLGPVIHAQWPALPDTSLFVLGLAIVASVGNLAALQRLVRIHRRVHAMR